MRQLNFIHIDLFVQHHLCLSVCLYCIYVPLAFNIVTVVVDVCACVFVCVLITFIFVLQTLLQVSWVRHRDIHLLTVGRYTYTSDQRFKAIHHAHSEDWILQIKYPQHRDSGIYECQVMILLPTVTIRYLYFSV